MISYFLSIVVSITMYGAVSNNEAVNNAGAINRAIDDCASKGGGRVVVLRSYLKKHTLQSGREKQ